MTKMQASTTESKAVLSAEQRLEYENNGLLFLPSLFTEAEIKVLTDEAARLQTLRRPEIARSEDGEPRVALGLQRYSAVFRDFLRSDKLLGLAQELLGEDVYCHQYKIVFRSPLGSLDFPWHQDYGNWQDLDGMPAPEALNISIFLDPVTEFNGAVAFIPGSHKHGRIETLREELPASETTLATLNLPVIRDLVDHHGLVPPKGPAGSAVIFHGLTAHASTPSISPYTRNIMYVTLNPIRNAIRKPTRPEYFAHTEFLPLKTLAEVS
jgi:ectoine hydroxylase